MFTRLKNVSIITTLLLFVFTASAGVFHAQTEPIEGIWFNEKKDAKIQVYKGNDGKYYGKIVWLKDPLKNGKPKTDDKNPKQQLRNQPIVGLIILKGLVKEDDGYADGTVYDPENGKTYDCKMSCKGKTISLRGYIGISLIGRSTVWEKAS
jgi:uncharacterized protein (DUF2147 family)